MKFMSQSQKERVFTLEKEILQMPGFNIFKTLGEMNDAYYISEENYKEANRFLEEYETNFDVTRFQEKFEEDNRIIKRYLHNYLASVYSFEQNLCHYIKKIQNEQINQIFRDNLNEYKSYDLRQFIIRLRVIIQHTNPIDPIIYVQFNQHRQATTKITFNRDVLLSYKDNWKAQGKRYLESAPKRIHIRDIINQQQAILNHLFTKTKKEIGTTCEKELKEFVNKKNEQNKLLAEIFKKSKK
jgi:hypothetical protein